MKKKINLTSQNKTYRNIRTIATKTFGITACT